MNLFENILAKSNPLPDVKSQFMSGFQQSQPQPQIVQQKKPTMSLFSDEVSMLGRMKADNIPDDTAFSMLKKRRTDLLGGNPNITPDEQSMLLKMQAANIPAKQATAMIQKRRADKAGAIKDMHSNEGVVEQTLKAPFRAIGDVATQAFKGIGQGVEGATNLVFRSVNDLNNLAGSSDYSPELTKALPQGGYVGDVAKLGAGTTTSIFNAAKAPIALGINTANQLPGTQYVTQGIGKLIQYGAENIGELAGVDKETSMDIATTGMNLLGMKPGINTAQYGRNIKNAYAGIETPGVFGRGIVPATIEAVKAPGQALVQTAKMPYDIAKGTLNIGKNALRNIQPSIASASDAIQTGINRMTKGEINKFQAEQGVSPGKYLNDRGIVSSGKPIEEVLLEQMKSSRDQATAGIDAIQGNYKMPSRTFGDTKIDYLREMLQDNYNKAKNTLDAEGTTRAKQLLDKYDSEGLTMTEINQSKRKMAENNPVNWLTDSASDRVQTVKKISDEVRNWQFQQAEKAGFTNLKEINKQTQAFYKLHEGITKWNDGIEANNKISLTDYLAFDADPSVFLAKKVLSSPKVRQTIVKGLNKVSGRVVKPTEKATIGTINTKRAEYDFGNSNIDIGDRVDTRKRLMISAPTGKATGAKNVRVNQPMETTGYKNDTQVGKRPTGDVKTENTAVQLAKESEKVKKLNSIKDEIAINTKAARYGGSGNERIEQGIKTALSQKKITTDEAKDILMDIFEDVTSGSSKYSYVNKAKLEEYINDFYKGPKTIVKPNTIKNESKVEIGKEIKNDNITIEGKKFNGNTILIDGKEVGGVSYRVYPNDAKTIELSKIEIYPEFQGNNYARKVIEKILKDNPNSKEISLSAAKTAEPIWEKLGFKFKDHITKEGKVYGISRSDFLSNIKSNAKQPLIKPISGDTIPEGYFKNAFGEIQKNPSNSKGGFIKIPEIGKKVEPLIEEAKKYKSVDDFINSQPKLYRGQKETMSSLKMNNPEQKSNTLGDAFHFTTDIELAKQYGKIQEIPFQLKDVLTAKEVEKITSDAQVKLDKLVSKGIYEGKEYDMLEELAIGKYPDIAKHLNKPFIKTGRYNDTEILYFPKYDTTKSQLKQIYNQSKSIVKNPLVEEARKIPKMNKGQEDLFKKDYGDFIDLELELKRAIKQGIPKKEVIKKIKYIERAVSEDEYRSIIKNGYIQSNSNKNFSNQLGDTYYHTEGKGTSFYLPENGGYIVKIKVKPEHNIDINEVGEVFTNKKIPISDIVEIQGGNGIVKTK